MIRPIALPDSVGDFNRDPIPQGLSPGFEHSLPVIRMDDGHPVEASVFFGGLTGHFLPAAYFADNIAVGCGTPDRRVVEIPKPDGGVCKLGIPTVTSQCTSVRTVSGCWIIPDSAGVADPVPKRLFVGRV